VTVGLAAVTGAPTSGDLLASLRAMKVNAFET
jgi:hypothetical protein